MFIFFLVSSTANNFGFAKAATNRT